MLAQSSIVLLALLPCLFARPTSVQKRLTGVTISAGRDGLCLATPPNPTDGAPVTSAPCVDASLWDISPGSGSILLSGTNFALDAGSNPGNNGALKVWQSYPGLYQQTWYLTDDKRIAITGGDQCLDEGVNGVQTYQCTTGNTNQIWNVGGSQTTPVPSSSSSAAPIPSQSAPAVKPGKLIHPYGDTTKCMTVGNGYAGVGTEVVVTGCFDNSDNFAYLQLWDYSTTNPGAIRLASNPYADTLCLDAGDNPANGSGMKVWTCYDGLLQQTWSYNGQGLASLANGQCLDVQAESGPTQTKPYGSLQNIQTWECSASDPQQQFTSP